MASVKELLMMAALFTDRQLNIIYGDLDKLDRQPTKLELQRIVDLCNERFDYDTLSLLNSRFDLSDIFEDDGLEEVTPEQIQQAENDFVSFMRQINPDFEMPVPIPSDKKEL